MKFFIKSVQIFLIGTCSIIGSVNAAEAGLAAAERAAQDAERAAQAARSAQGVRAMPKAPNEELQKVQPSVRASQAPHVP